MKRQKIDDLVMRLRYGVACSISGVKGDLAQDMTEAAYAIESLQRQNETLRHEHERAIAWKDLTVKILTRIHSFISPEDITLPDGRRFEFNNPAIEHEMLKALSSAIRAVPEELKKAESAQPEKEW